MGRTKLQKNTTPAHNKSKASNKYSTETKASKKEKNAVKQHVDNIVKKQVKEAIKPNNKKVKTLAVDHFCVSAIDTNSKKFEGIEKKVIGTFIFCVPCIHTHKLLYY